MDHSVINGRYRMDRLLGEGGMAEVYLGYDLLLQRTIAIKRLRAQYARDPNFRARFEREAQAAASFTHPNIIDIFDVGEDHDTLYIIMEYVPGDDLAHIIATEGPFDPEDVAILVEQVAAALDYAHQRGFVHRDIKPHNILVDHVGLAKVVDFGIAKGVGDSDLTDVGTGFGSVHYISPEQASGLMATPSSDIYSLGVIAYEMLTGRLPFNGDTPVGIAMQHISNIPPHPSTVNPRVPREVGDLVMRALDKNPTARFQSAGAFAEALTHWRAHTQSHQQSLNQPTAPVPRPTTPKVQMRGQHAAAATAVLPPVSVASRPPVAVSAAQSSPPNRWINWIAGLTMIVALGVALWFGFQHIPLLNNTGRANAPSVSPPTAVATAQPANDEPTPAIILRDTEQPTIAPVLTGLSLTEAQNIAQQTGFQLIQQDPEPSDTVEQGYILAQKPKAGDPIPDKQIAITVSSGAEIVDVAALDLVGQQADTAQAILEDHHLQVNRQNQGDSSVAEDHVIAIDPNTTANPNDTVTLIVSMGDKVQIPPVIQGGPLDEAIDTLEREGFVISATIPVSATTIESFGIDLTAAGITNGDVVGIQDNGASFGVWLPPGTAVTLVYYDSSLT